MSVATNQAFGELNVLKNVAPTSPEDAEIIVDFLKTHFAARQGPLKILEAGCGQRWVLDLEGFDYQLIGVDQSKDAVESRQQKVNDLDQAIVGDLRTVEFPEHEFDLIYNSYVLEHVDGAEQALLNFSHWLKPGGILVLRIPDPTTAYSFLANHLPFWMHVVLKRAMGAKNAGKPGYDPFPTFFDEVVSRRGIHEFCRSHNQRVHLEYSYGYDKFEPMYPIGHIVLKTLGAVSLGKLAGDRTDLLFVIEQK
jgi:SAM-dependent methyltransferase